MSDEATDAANPPAFMPTLFRIVAVAFPVTLVFHLIRAYALVQVQNVPVTAVPWRGIAMACTLMLVPALLLRRRAIGSGFGWLNALSIPASALAGLAWMVESGMDGTSSLDRLASTSCYPLLIDMIIEPLIGIVWFAAAYRFFEGAAPRLASWPRFAVVTAWKWGGMVLAQQFLLPVFVFGPLWLMAESQALSAPRRSMWLSTLDAYRQAPGLLAGLIPLFVVSLMTTSFEVAVQMNGLDSMLYSEVQIWFVSGFFQSGNRWLILVCLWRLHEHLLRGGGEPPAATNEGGADDLALPYR